MWFNLNVTEVGAIAIIASMKTMKSSDYSEYGETRGLQTLPKWTRGHGAGFRTFVVEWTSDDVAVVLQSIAESTGDVGGVRMTLLARRAHTAVLTVDLPQSIFEMVVEKYWRREIGVPVSSCVFWAIDEARAREPLSIGR